MPKYEVTLKEIEVYHFDKIEAVDRSEAEEKAWALLSGDDKYKYHQDSDGESEILEL